jgi:putative membrane protein
MNRPYSILALSLLALPAFADEKMSTMSAPPSDSEITQIMETANTNEVDAGKLAMKKTTNADVKEFAGMMVKDHSGVVQETRDVEKKISVKPMKSVASKELDMDAKKNEKKLKGMKGSAFDKEYVNQMVADHQAVLNTIDQTLLPNAKSDDLKALITKIRPAVEAHLQHAKTLQAKLEANAG